MTCNRTTETIWWNLPTLQATRTTGTNGNLVLSCGSHLWVRAWKAGRSSTAKHSMNTSVVCPGPGEWSCSHSSICNGNTQIMCGKTLETWKNFLSLLSCTKWMLIFHCVPLFSGNRHFFFIKFTYRKLNFETELTPSHFFERMLKIIGKMNKINIIIIIKVLGTTPLKLTNFFFFVTRFWVSLPFKNDATKMYVPAQQNNFFIVNLVIA